MVPNLTHINNKITYIFYGKQLKLCIGTERSYNLQFFKIIRQLIQYFKYKSQKDFFGN